VSPSTPPAKASHQPEFHRVDGHYSYFFVGNKSDGYRLRLVSCYKPTDNKLLESVDGFFAHAKKSEDRLMDGLLYSNGRRFSTRDVDQDRWGQHDDPVDVDNCSKANGGGGWWYNGGAGGAS
jgi:hypothetical protein